MAVYDEYQRKIDQTSTWAVALVVAVIVAVSLLIEYGLHKLGHWFAKKRKMGLFEALEKVKSELMLMGFISLLLILLGNQIARICVPEDLARRLLPCEAKSAEEVKDRRRLLSDETFAYVSGVVPRRTLAGSAYNDDCSAGKVSLVSPYAIHQLHVFIFFLAVFHVLTGAITMGLGRLKIRRWKVWEEATGSLDYEFSNDPSRFRFAHENVFVRQHMSVLTKNPVLFYMVSFFRQFFRSVRKEDYQTMRHGFITAHLAPGSKFNFQKYIMMSLEDDFKVVVGISPSLWAAAVIFLLLDVRGWMTIFWVSIVPLIILLAVGTKLQAIITKMALEIKERNVVIEGAPVVQLNDRHFWFKKPSLMLYLIHFTLFLNAFQLIFFLFIWYKFGFRSCFHEKIEFVIARIVIGVVVQILCSYVTLPLYALVSQLGSHMKRSIFDNQASHALKKWRKNVKKKHVPGKSVRASPSSGVSPSGSPGKTFSRQRSLVRSASSGTVQLRYYSDQEMSDTDNETSSPNAGFSGHGHRDLEAGRGRTDPLRPRLLEQQEQKDGDDNGRDFSFG